MGSLGDLAHAGAGAPHCPICDGPCRHDFERSAYSFPDRIPRAADELDEPVKDAKPNRRGARAVHGPEEDRMVHGPEEDR